ncbi:MAG: hypothetical protein U0Q18_29105 [Bryobacteraceae bacterium]
MISRRNFLQKAGAAAGSPIILGATNKSGSAKPILGEGDHKYECTHDWGDLPANIKYGNTHGVCEDAHGHIYVHHTVNDTSESHDSMVVFDSKGKFVKSWGKEFKGGAHGLHIHKEGKDQFLYLCDTKRAIVVKTTLNGEEVFTLGYPKESEAYKLDAEGKPAKYSPTNLAIAPNGDLYIGDGYGSSYINQYDKNGKYIRTFGGKGKEPGQLDCPHGITVDLRGKDPLLLVADRGNNRLQYLTLEGKHVSFVEGTHLPCHFSERHGEYVIPDLGARVTLMSREDKVITHLGDDSAANTWEELRKQSRDHFMPGKFVCPHGACFDHAGNIFVVEWVEVGRVSKLRKVA